MKTTNKYNFLKVYSMEGKKLFEAKEKSDMFMRQVFPFQHDNI